MTPEMTRINVIKRSKEMAEILDQTHGRIQREMLMPLIERLEKLMKEKANDG